jgi:hypothetical protein
VAAIADVIPDIRVHIPEIPSFVAQREILRSAREFCEKTRTWRQSFDLSTLADVATYDLISQAGLTNVELVDVVSIKNTEGGEPLKAKTFAWLDRELSDWRSETAEHASWFVLESNNTLRLVYTPASATTDKYHVRMAVKPLLTSDALSDVIENKYDEFIIHGALSRLYFIPRKPWSDARLGAYHREQFELSWPGARADAANEFQTGVIRKIRYGGL